MTSIYLIRHTQAEGNLYRMMQGHWDGHVTKAGLHQIDCLAERFKDVHIDAVYSSDLSRAVETAGAITKYHDLQIIKDSRLREINMGPWEAQFFGNIKYSDFENIRCFMLESEKWKIDGAETFNDVKQRAYSALEEIARLNDGKTIAVVSHGVTIRCLLSKINNAPFDDIKRCPICKNTAVAHLEYSDGMFECEYFNDISHLGPDDEYHWWKTDDIRDEIINLDDKDDRKFYVDCYRDAWSTVHNGDISSFDAQTYVMAAKKHTVYKLLADDTVVGVIELSDKYECDGYGWISLLYILPQFRHKGYGIQGLGRAIRHFSGRNLNGIRLLCACENASALKFYKDYDYAIIGIQEGLQCPLYLMERKFY